MDGRAIRLNLWATVPIEKLALKRHLRSTGD
jgi:hypothetical protein